MLWLLGALTFGLGILAANATFTPPQLDPTEFGLLNEAWQLISLNTGEDPPQVDSFPATTTTTLSTTTTTNPPTTTTPPSTTSPTSTLIYSPPAMTNPLIINAAASTTDFPRKGDPVNPGNGNYFPADRDVIIYLSTTQKITQSVTVKGGRNVRIVGGEWDLKSGDVCLVIDSPSKSVFVEGAHANSGTAGLYPDIFVLRNRDSATVPGAGPYDIYFQNCLVDYALYQGSADANHIDAIQDQTETVPTGNIYIENVSITTSDQGIFWQNHGPSKSIHLRNVDLQYGAPPVANGALLWIREDGDSTPVLPGSMNNVYVGDNPWFSPWYTTSVWPKNYNIPDEQWQPYHFWTWGTMPSADGQSVTFEPAAQITGTIRRGPPPGGHFVQAANVGLNYKSPWP